VIGAALLTRWSLWSLLGPELPFLLLWPAVMVCAWLGGFGPGVLATLLSLAAADFLLLEPAGTFGLKSPADWAGMGMFLVLGCFWSSGSP
jgi:K+-sensing histidine kinase KdpD